MINVILIEDHKIVRQGLKALLELESDITVIGECEDGATAVEMATNLKPDVIVMDIALPKLNGIEASRQIMSRNQAAKILVLSAHGDDGYIEKVSAIGVSGYLVKQCSPELLIEAIREIDAGKKFFCETVNNRLGILQQKNSPLTQREAQVLQLIAEGKANKQVASELKISIKTVEKHRQNLMKKLSIHDTAGLTRYAIAEGIVESSSQRTFDESSSGVV
jgi:DNA-binding NarL/FixJ family response regulator